MLLKYPISQLELNDVRSRLDEVGIWFVPVPRIASRSIRMKLGEMHGALFAHEDAFRGHGLAVEYRGVLGKDVWSRLFSFGFVRNPWDRMVSGYHYQKLDISFEQWILNKKWHEFETPQSMFLLDENGKQLVSHVGRYENFNEELEFLDEKIGLGLIGKEHVSKRTSYCDYYNETTRDIVAKCFDKDIEFFGYKFE